MNIRIWDLEGRYKEGFVKEYEHWVLEVSFRQHTLGCFIIFAKRNIERISELYDVEIIELKNIMKEFESTCSSIKEFMPDRYNYLQMGNALHHLHFHAIPRYAKPRRFRNKEWIDTTFGHPPVWSKLEADKITVVAIKETFLSQTKK